MDQPAAVGPRAKARSFNYALATRTLPDEVSVSNYAKRRFCERAITPSIDDCNLVMKHCIGVFQSPIALHVIFTCQGALEVFVSHILLPLLCATLLLQIFHLHRWHTYSPNLHRNMMQFTAGCKYSFTLVALLATSSEHRATCKLPVGTAQVGAHCRSRSRRSGGGAHTPYRIASMVSANTKLALLGTGPAKLESKWESQ